MEYFECQQKSIAKLEQVEKRIESCLEEIENLLNSSQEQQDRHHTNELIEEFLQKMSQQESNKLEDYLLLHVHELAQQANQLAPDVQLWPSVSAHLRRHIEGKLAVLAATSSPWTSDICSRHQLYLRIKQLSHFLPLDEVWKIHQAFRNQILESPNCFCCPSHPLALCFKCLLAVTRSCVEEDQEVICMGYFRPMVITWTDLFSAYTPSLLSSLDAIVLSISKLPTWSELSTLPESFAALFSADSSHFREVETELPHPQSYLDGLLARFNKVTPLPRKECQSVHISLVVIGLIKHLLHFENRVMNIYSRDDCISIGSPTATDNFNKIISPHMPVDSPEQSPNHQEMNSTENVFSHTMDWRSRLVERGLLLILQKSLETQIKEAMEATMLPLQNGGRPILGDVGTLISELELFLSVLPACQGALLPFAASFNHVVYLHLTPFLTELRSVFTRSPPDLDTIFLLDALGATARTRQALKSYTAAVAWREPDGGDASVLSLLQKASQLQTLIRESVRSHWMRIVVCGLLQDPDSQDWGNPRPYYEGERMSPVIQSWNLFMWGLLHDCQCRLPAPLCRDVVLEAMQLSLEHLAWRYGLVEPSEARVGQLRADLTGLLAAVSELLWPCCPSLASVLGRSLDPQLQSIHQLCQSILTTIAAKCPVVDQEVLDGVPWLCWARPELAKPPGLKPEAELWLCGQMALSSIVPSPVSVVKTFLLHEGSLALRVLTQLADEEYECAVGECQDLRIHLASCILQLLQASPDNPQAVAHALVSVVQRSGGWKEFDPATLFEPVAQRAWWYQALMLQLNAYLYRRVLMMALPAVKSKLELVRETQPEHYSTFHRSLSAAIRCSCLHLPLEEQPLSRKEGFSSAVHHLVASLHDSLVFLPPPLKHCLRLLGRQPGKHAHLLGCLPLQLLVGGLHAALRSCPQVEPSLAPVSQLSSQLANSLASMTAALLDGSPAKKSSFSSLLLDIKQSFSAAATIQSHQGLPLFDQFEDHSFLIATTQLLAQTNGQMTLDHLTNFLRRNEEWLQTSLGIPRPFTEEEPCPPPRLDLCLEAKKPRKFDPLAQVDSFGSHPFTQEYLLARHLPLKTRETEVD